METGVLVCFFKPTRFACGETRRYYFATLSQSHLAEGLLTRPHFAGVDAEQDQFNWSPKAIHASRI